MSVTTLTMNGTLVSAAEGATLLDVAREHHVPIPTLCHFEGLSEVGACRLCLVEVEGSNRLQAACMTKAVEGMTVTTNSEALRTYRRQIVELLLAERNHVCSVCVANRKCELQDLAVSMGLHHVRYEPQAPQLSMDASHPRWILDHNRCVLCTRCVRVCDEIEGAHTWDVMGRGRQTLVISDLHEPWGQSESCTSCGKCVRVCPTGALFEKGTSATNKDPHFVTYLRMAREQRLWNR
ncbi:MAG: bidirectional hydrogenase complex protein HoxU [Vicinamibacterales bacterium]